MSYDPYKSLFLTYNLADHPVPKQTENFQDDAYDSHFDRWARTIHPTGWMAPAPPDEHKRLSEDDTILPAFELVQRGAARGKDTDRVEHWKLTTPEVMKKRGIVLKDYQAQAALQLANDYDSGGKGMLLAFEQGTGKTLITIGEAAQSSVHLN